MQSITAAAALLAGSDQTETLDEILAELGFPEAPLSLDALARERLGLPYGIVAAQVARAEGTLRGLVLTVDKETPVREVLSKVAARFTARVPHLLWLVIALQPETSTVAFATWGGAKSPPRVAALVVDRTRIVDSDAETLCALAGCASLSNDVMRHARWLDVLGREAVTRRFYRTLERVVGVLADSLGAAIPAAESRELALLYASRLLFLSFLETKGWLNHDFGFLVNGFADCMARGGRYQQRVLTPLFFGTLNTRPTARATRAHAFGKIPFLNGGLFARTALERRWRTALFPDEALGTLYGDLLSRYRFTAREDTTLWSEAAIDPEMLGKAFESLMAPQERKQSGSYYTPHTLVERLTTLSLTEALATEGTSQDIAAAALAGTLPNSNARGILLDRTASLRILDPACGSGAFLVHALEQLAALRARLGDPRPLAAIRRAVLTTSIYGVDVNPMAVWLCELRLWLSTVIESDERDPMRVLPLPNLDHQIHIGDTLMGGAFDGSGQQHSARSIVALRQRYARAHGPRKRILANSLDRLERQRAIAQLDRSIAQYSARRRELVCAARTHNLFAERSTPSGAERDQLRTFRESVRRLRAQRRRLADGGALPFTFAAHFADVADAGGFDAIVGNPPWVRLHHISPADRATLRSTFSTFRDAAWNAGATHASAGAGFAGQADLAALFVERSAALLAPGGIVGLLLPAKLWRSLAGGGTRTLLQTQLRLVALEDFSDAPSSFSAAVYPSLIVAQREQAVSHTLVAPSSPLPPLPPPVPVLPPPTLTSMVTVAVHRAETSMQWRTPVNSLALDTSPGSPWLLLPPVVRKAFDTIARAGTLLVQTPFGRPYLGVKSGCNEAFIVHEHRLGQETDDETANGDVVPADGPLAHVRNSIQDGVVERAQLRPLARGETVGRWTLYPSGERMIWTHEDDGTPLRTLPPLTHRWLARWRPALEQRSDLRGSPYWWSLFRTDSADTSHPRVVWNDVGKSPRAAVLAPGDPTIPLNTCYVVRCPTLQDAYAFTALLNAPLTAAWLGAIAEPARGGYRRHLGWTMALLPIPRDWARARAVLAPLAERAVRGSLPSGDELHGALLHAYRLRADAVEPLMVWDAR